MAAERGPLIPLGILLDKSKAAKRAVRVLNASQTEYQSMVIMSAYETILGRLDDANFRRLKAKDLRVRRDKLTEQLKDYENFKREGKGKKPRFVVDSQKLNAFLATKEQRVLVDSDITRRARELRKASG